MKRYLLVMGLLFGLVTVAENASDPLARVANSLSHEEVHNLILKNGQALDLIRLDKLPAEFTNRHYRFKSMKSANNEQICRFMQHSCMEPIQGFAPTGYSGQIPWKIMELTPVEAVNQLLLQNLPPIYNKLAKCTWSVDESCLEELPASYRVIQADQQLGCFVHGTNHSFLQVDPNRSFLIYLETGFPLFSGLGGGGGSFKMVQLSYAEAQHLGHILYLINSLKFTEEAKEEPEVTQYTNCHISFRDLGGYQFEQINGDFWSDGETGRLWRTLGWLSRSRYGVQINFASLIIPQVIDLFPSSKIIAKFDWGWCEPTGLFTTDLKEPSDEAWEALISGKLSELIDYIPFEEDFALIFEAISAKSRVDRLKCMLPALNRLNEKLATFGEADNDSKGRHYLDTRNSWESLHADLSVTCHLLSGADHVPWVREWIQKSDYLESVMYENLSKLDQKVYLEVVEAFYQKQIALKPESVYQVFLPMVHNQSLTALQSLAAKYQNDVRLNLLASDGLAELVEKARVKFDLALDNKDDTLYESVCKSLLLDHAKFSEQKSYSREAVGYRESLQLKLAVIEKYSDFKSFKLKYFRWFWGVGEIVSPESLLDGIRQQLEYLVDSEQHADEHLVDAFEDTQHENKVVEDTPSYPEVACQIRQALANPDDIASVGQLLEENVTQHGYLKQWSDPDYPILLQELFYALPQIYSENYEFLNAQILFYLAHQKGIELEPLLTSLDQYPLKNWDETCERAIRIIHRFANSDYLTPDSDYVDDFRFLFRKQSLNNELLEILWILGLDEFKHDLAKMGTASEDELENPSFIGIESIGTKYQLGDWQVKSHTARQFAQVMFEDDPQTKARLLVALKNHYEPYYPEQFRKSVHTKLDQLVQSNPRLMVNLDAPCAFCGLYGQFEHTSPDILYVWADEDEEKQIVMAGVRVKLFPDESGGDDFGGPEDETETWGGGWGSEEETAEVRFQSRLMDYGWVGPPSKEFETLQGKIKLFDWVSEEPSRDEDLVEEFGDDFGGFEE